MTEMNTTWLVFIGAFATCLCALEWYGWHYYGTAGTLSDHVRYWTNLHPLVPFSLGCMVGALSLHFWGK